MTMAFNPAILSSTPGCLSDGGTAVTKGGCYRFTDYHDRPV